MRNAQAEILKNTGTCSYCGRGGLKVEGDRVSNHGYAIHFGNAKGKCPGSRKFSSETNKVQALADISELNDAQAEIMDRCNKTDIAKQYRSVAAMARKTLEAIPCRIP